MGKNMISKREKKFYNLLNANKDMFTDEEIDFLAQNFKYLLSHQKIAEICETKGPYVFLKWLKTNKSENIQQFIRDLYYSIQNDSSQELLISMIYSVALQLGKEESDAEHDKEDTNEDD